MREIGHCAFGIDTDGQAVPMWEYAARTPGEVKGKVLTRANAEGFRGTADERLSELGWEVRPVFGEEPTPEQLSEHRLAQKLKHPRVERDHSGDTEGGEV